MTPDEGHMLGVGGRGDVMSGDALTCLDCEVMGTAVFFHAAGEAAISIPRTIGSARFCTGHWTDRQTDRPRYSVGNNRQHHIRSTAKRPTNNNNNVENTIA